MPLWGKTDLANNAPKFVAGMLHVGSGPVGQKANNTALYANTTANAFVPKQTVGIFGVSITELRVANVSSEAKKTKGPGWQLRTVGSGGRAGRIHYEPLAIVKKMGNGNTAQFPIT